MGRLNFGYQFSWVLANITHYYYTLFLFFVICLHYNVICDNFLFFYYEMNN